MAKVSQGQTRSADTNVLAAQVATISMGPEIEETKNVTQRAKLGRAVSKSGAENLTAWERSEIAEKAAGARWAK